MAQSQDKKASETLELPKMSRDVVLAHLKQAEDEYTLFRQEYIKQASQLRESRAELITLDDTVISLKASLASSEAENKIRARELNQARTQLYGLERTVENLTEGITKSQEQLEQERKSGHRYRERTVQLADSLKHIHRALFEGGVYGLILKACLAITGATRGLYLTTRGDDTTYRVRAAQDVDDYPAAPPSNFIKAICNKVLEDNDTLVYNDESELGSMPRPERPGEQFQNLVATPVVLLRSLSGIIIAADKLNGDFDKEDVETLLSVGDQAAVAVKNHHLQRELENSYIATVSMLADAVEAKDPYTHGHCDLVSRYARLTAERLNLSPQDRSIVCYSALLHDVGKIGVSDGILNKPGPLVPEERDLMRSHVRVGHDLIAKVPALAPVAEVVLHHHEWYDGSGYPEGLKGEAIPMAARIVGVVDAFCAMITKRSYKDAYSVDRAKGELLRCSSTQFDPKVVEVFLEVLDTVETDDLDDSSPICGVLPSFAYGEDWQHIVH